MLVVYKGIWQFDAMEAMTNLILLDRRFQLFYLVTPCFTQLLDHTNASASDVDDCNIADVFWISCGGVRFHGW